MNHFLACKNCNRFLSPRCGGWYCGCRFYSKDPSGPDIEQREQHESDVMVELDRASRVADASTEDHDAY